MSQLPGTPARRPRVALVAYDVIGHQGTGRVITELVRRAHDRLDFVVIARNVAQDLRPLVEWKRAPAPARPYKAQLAAFYVTGGLRLATTRADLVHVHSIGVLVPNRVDLDSVHFCRRGFMEATGVVGPGGLTGFHLALERRCRLRARMLAALSEGSRRELVRFFPGVPVVVTPNGVDAERFAPDEATRAGLRQEEGVGDGEVVALFVANSWHQKGLGVAIEALGIAARSGRAPDRLWVVGYGSEDRYGELAREHGVGDRVRFFGLRSDVERFYRAADLFVLPTLYEQCCLSVYEAAAAGLPVVTTPVSGMEELIGQDEAGLIVPRDPAAVASGLARLAADPGLRSRLGETGRARAAATTWERTVDGILDAYRRLGLEF